MYMLNINLYFDDEQGNELKKKKDASGLNWRNFILLSCGIITPEDLNFIQ